MMYFEGDFKKSLSFAQQMRKDYVNGNAMKYQLLGNNCMQVSIDLLLKGTFKNHDSDYKSALNMAKGKIIPNNAYYGMSRFNQNIDAYNQKNWWDKFWTHPTKDPWNLLKH